MRTSDAPPSLAHVPWLLARFAPFYARHLLLRPYRGERPAASLRGLLAAPVHCHRTAMYDAVLELMLRGYAELAGHPLRPETGRVAVMFTRIGFAFDDEYERRETGAEGLAFDEVFGSGAVRAPLEQWQLFMRDVEGYPRIRTFMAGFVRRLYAEYRRNMQGPGVAGDFDVAVRSAVLDSGGLLVALAHVVGLLHDRPPAEATLAEFTSLGLNAKLADDIVDFADDHAAGRPNLLQLRAEADEGERARVAGAVAARRRMSARWWRRNCPAAHREIAAVYERHQARMSSTWLRYASRLMWVPALLGHGRAVETRGRI